MTKGVLKNKFLEIEYSTTSLRVTSLALVGKNNMLADLSSSAPIFTPFGDFHFEGGHRLWHAPEAMPRTYVPDGNLTITEVANGIVLEPPTESGTGIRKKMEIRLASDEPSLTLTHTLINDGMWAVELSPWAITQFRLGGTVILPLPVGNTDPVGLLHNRQFSMWPYASFKDPRLNLNDRFVLFKADALPPFKIGYWNTHGWIAYRLEGTLFRKSFDVRAGLSYPDNNCNAEMYCNDKFVELETLGPLTTLSPGTSVTHVETWELFDGIESLPAEVQQLLV